MIHIHERIEVLHDNNLAASAFVPQGKRTGGFTVEQSVALQNGRHAKPLQNLHSFCVTTVEICLKLVD